MTFQKPSVNQICAEAVAVLLMLSAAFIAVLYLLTRNMAAVWCTLMFLLMVLLWAVFLIAALHRKLSGFSGRLCTLMDDMTAGKMELPEMEAEESLFYKINHRLIRLYEIMEENRHSVAEERAELQELISDIAHQVKTPIANLKMVNATLLEEPVPEEKQKEFLQAVGGELDKLDFLMQAMIKTSRLETGVISLEKKEQPIYDTLAAALGGILLSAEKKRIEVRVDCGQKLCVSHDRKWTGEALFNLLDNAVKYTPSGGRICVSVEKQEMYLKIDIADTGKGIAEQNQGAVFKRFYREETVREVEGIGIGLYLAREIITMQGGYILVLSSPGQGSTFSVFLPRRDISARIAPYNHTINEKGWQFP